MAVSLAAVVVLVLAFRGAIWPTPTSPEIVKIENGQSSKFRDYSSFKGGCLTLREERDWEAFWDSHRRNPYQEPPEAPLIDFRQDMVLACFLGWSPTAPGGQIAIQKLESFTEGYWVHVRRNFTQGVSDVTTNPYDIVRVPFAPGPVIFVDAETKARIPELELLPI